MSKKPRTRGIKGGPEPTLALIVKWFATAVQLQYIDERGALKTHLFPKGAGIYATRDGTKLVIAPIKIKGKEIH